jgi:preprotein translocase subunit SecF
MLERQQQMFSKYRTVILVLSILLLVYALHLFPTPSIHDVSALLTDPHVEVF